MTQHDDRHHPTLDNQEHPVNMQMTPELFLSLPHHPEDDHEDTEPVLYADPLQVIASALERLAGDVATAVRGGLAGAVDEIGETYAVAPTGEDGLRARITELEAELSQLDVLLTTRTDVADLMSAQLDEIRAVVKPSVSKLANAVRAVLDGGEPAQPESTGPTEPEAVDQPQEPVAQPTGAPTPDEAQQAVPSQAAAAGAPAATPAPNAPIEDWRAFARSLGYQGSDVDWANRSQIRTMLGLAHPGQDGAA